MTTYWAPLLHIYQPPTQDIKILRVINKECYKPLFSILEQQNMYIERTLVHSKGFINFVVNPNYVEFALN